MLAALQCGLAIIAAAVEDYESHDSAARADIDRLIALCRGDDGSSGTAHATEIAARSLLAAGTPGVHAGLREREGGATLLWLAADSGSLELVQVLLEAGADPDLGNALDGETALDVIMQQGGNDHPIARALRARGAQAVNKRVSKNSEDYEDDDYYVDDVNDGDNDDEEEDDEDEDVGCRCAGLRANADEFKAFVESEARELIDDMESGGRLGLAGALAVLGARLELGECTREEFNAVRARLVAHAAQSGGGGQPPPPPGVAPSANRKKKNKKRAAEKRKKAAAAAAAAAETAAAAAAAAGAGAGTRAGELVRGSAADSKAGVEVAGRGAGAGGAAKEEATAAVRPRLPAGLSACAPSLANAKGHATHGRRRPAASPSASTRALEADVRAAEAALEALRHRLAESQARDADADDGNDRNGDDGGDDGDCGDYGNGDWSADGEWSTEEEEEEEEDGVTQRRSIAAAVSAAGRKTGSWPQDRSAGLVQTISGWVPLYTGPRPLRPTDRASILPATCCGCGHRMGLDYGDDPVACDVCPKVACGGCAVKGYPDCGHC